MHKKRKTVLEIAGKILYSFSHPEPEVDKFSCKVPPWLSAFKYMTFRLRSRSPTTKHKELHCS